MKSPIYTIRRERIPATAVAPSSLSWVVRGPDGYAVAMAASKADAARIAAQLDAKPEPLAAHQ